MFDYSTLEADAEKLQNRIRDLNAKDMTPNERDECLSLMGQVHALEATAGKMKEAEIAGFKRSIRNGTAPIVGDHYGAGSDARDFLNYLRTGDIRNASMSTTDANGGLVVAEPLHAALIEKVRLVDGVYANCAQLDISGGDSSITLPYKSAHGAAVWAAESAARSEQNAPAFSSAQLQTYELYSDQRATQTVVDSIPDFEEMMLGFLYGDIYETLGTSLATGDGLTQCVGVFTDASGFTQIASTSASAMLNTNMNSMFFALSAKYRPNAKWYANSATISTLAGFSNPANADVPLLDTTGDVFKMLGKPVVEVEAAPAVGSDALCLAFGDLQAGYVCATHRKPTILVDVYTSSPKVRYGILARIGATSWDRQAMILLKCANTL